MMAIPFLDAAINRLKKQYYDDIGDRINYYYTVIFFVFFAIVVSAKQYVGQPIQCWVPAQFRGGWEQYAESYCFIQNTYFLPYEKGIPDEIIERDYRKIGYYQWIPIVLAIQAILFYMPNMIWKWFNGQSGIDVKAILRIATDSVGFDPEKRQKNVQVLARYIEESLALQSTIEKQRKSYGGGFFSKFGIDRRHFGNYLCFLYLFVKFLYLINVIGQIFLLNSFLGTSHAFWGLEMLTDLIKGREWEETGHFPRVTLCDFTIRELGQTHKHTIQCVLMINMFNEKIYLFLWFWLVLVAIITAANFVWWLLSCWPTSNRRLVHKYLKISHQEFFDGGVPPAKRRTMDSFVKNALKQDGILLLRFISGHAGDLVTIELTAILFKDYMKQIREQEATTMHLKGKAPAPPTLTIDSVDGEKNGIYKNGSNNNYAAEDGGFKEVDGEKTWMFKQ